MTNNIFKFHITCNLTNLVDFALSKDNLVTLLEAVWEVASEGGCAWEAGYACEAAIPDGCATEAGWEPYSNADGRAGWEADSEAAFAPLIDLEDDSFAFFIVFEPRYF